MQRVARQREPRRSPSAASDSRGRRASFSNYGSLRRRATRRASTSSRRGRAATPTPISGTSMATPARGRRRGALQGRQRRRVVPDDRELDQLQHHPRSDQTATRPARRTACCTRGASSAGPPAAAPWGGRPRSARSAGRRPRSAYSAGCRLARRPAVALGVWTSTTRPNSRSTAPRSAPGSRSTPPRRRSAGAARTRRWSPPIASGRASSPTRGWRP